MPNKEIPRVFVPEKKLSKKRKTKTLVFVLGIFLVLVAVTLFFIVKTKFSFGDFFTSVVKNVSLQNEQEETQTEDFKSLAREKIDKKLLNITEVSAKENFVNIKTKEGVEVFLDVKKNLSDQVRTLQTLLSKAKIEMREILVVDFRFEKLAVQYR